MDLTLLIAGLGLLCLLILGAAVGVGITNQKQANAWRRVAAERRRHWEQRHADIDYGGLDEYWGPEASPGRSSVILRLTEIENQAGKVLDDLVGPRDRQLFEVRSELRRLGIWSDRDIETFDRAMAVRNAVVHGSEAPEWTLTGKVSSSAMSELLSKLRAASAGSAEAG